MKLMLFSVDVEGLPIDVTNPNQQTISHTLLVFKPYPFYEHKCSALDF